MSKQLLLVRHAQAEAPNTVQKDFDRELNATGYAEALRMGKCLAEKSVRPDAVYASPSRRTTTTAQLMAEQLGFPFDRVVFEEGIYEGSVRNLMQVINGLAETHACVMLIGHNPHVSYLAEYLTHREIGTLPTGGVVAVTFSDQTWAALSSNTGQLAWYEHP